MAAAISILSCSDRHAVAALHGDFTGDSTEFLARHLDELPGDVTLECEHLGAVDEPSARVMLAFREARIGHGHRVMFRGIPRRCRRLLLEQARHRRSEREYGHAVSQ